MHHRNVISIWFFIGILLLVYGLAIFASSLMSLGEPPRAGLVLAELHAPIWWGALLIVLGAIYAYLFSPWRKN